MKTLVIFAVTCAISLAISSPRHFNNPNQHSSPSKKSPSEHGNVAFLKLRCRNPVYRRANREICERIVKRKDIPQSRNRSPDAKQEKPQRQAEPPKSGERNKRPGDSRNQPPPKKSPPRQVIFQRPNQNQGNDKKTLEEKKKEKRSEEPEAESASSKQPKQQPKQQHKLASNEDEIPASYWRNTKKPMTETQLKRIRIFVHECRTRPSFVKRHPGICGRVLGESFVQNFYRTHPAARPKEKPQEKKKKSQESKNSKDETQNNQRQSRRPSGEKREEKKPKKQKSKEEPAAGEESEATLMRKCRDVGWLNESPSNRHRCTEMMMKRQREQRNKQQQKNSRERQQQQQQQKDKQSEGTSRAPQPKLQQNPQQPRPGQPVVHSTNHPPAKRRSADQHNRPPQRPQPPQRRSPDKPKPKPYLPNVAQFTPDQRAVFARNCKSERFANASPTNRHICKQMKEIEKHRAEERQMKAQSKRNPITQTGHIVNQNQNQPPHPPNGPIQPGVPLIQPGEQHPADREEPNPQPAQPQPPHENPQPGEVSQQTPPERLPVALLTHPCLPMDNMCRPALTFDVRDPISPNMPLTLEWKLNGEMMGKKQFHTQRITFDMFSKMAYEFRLAKVEGGSNRVLAAFDTDRIVMQRPNNLGQTIFVQLKVKGPNGFNLQSGKALMSSAVGPDSGRIGVAQEGEWFLFRAPANDRNKLLLERVRGAFMQRHPTVPVFCLEGGSAGNASGGGSNEEESGKWFESASFLIYAGLFGLALIGVGTYYVFSSGALNPVLKQSAVVQAVNQRRGRVTKTEMEPLVSNEDSYRTSPRGLTSSNMGFEQKRRSVPVSQFSG